MKKLEKELSREWAGECGVSLSYEPSPNILTLAIIGGAIGGFALSGISEILQHPEYLNIAKNYIKPIF